MRRSTNSIRLPLAAAALFCLTAGCGRDSVKVYKVDSSDSVVTTPPPVAATAPAAMPTTMPDGLPVPDNSGLPKLKYTLPAGWMEKPLTQLRVASFDISEGGKTADVSVIPLGGSAGGDAANVNRWRGQVGQSPLDEAGLKNSAEAAQVAGQPADLYDVAGSAPGSGDDERILGAILHTDESTWYFKMMGDSALAEKNKPAFIAFLKSVEFEKPAAAATMDLSQLPASHPALPGMGAAAPADKPTWTVPAGWKEGELMQFLVARYVIQGNGDASAAVNVSQLDGNGGGLLPNLNRWRSQLGQPAMSDDDLAKLPSIDASGTKAVLVDFTGTDARAGKAARLIGMVLPLNGQTWFYKLMGDPDVVGQQKDAFINFAQSAQYPAAK
ncbi:MAG: hypothetical protein ABSH48_07245 [Verrucomicrobiota bacterium]|jgi:hypothetical protein